ncbi:MAG: hypothetical protein ACOX6M_04380 [Armatimonadota bacterium]|jgi:hypothetical protein
MGVTGIVRIGWQSKGRLNSTSETILTKERSPGQLLFEKVQTAAYRCVGANDVDVYAAVQELLGLMHNNAGKVDSVFISLVREKNTT